MTSRLQCAISYSPSVIGHQLLAISYWRSVIGYRLLAIGYRLSAIGYSKEISPRAARDSGEL